MCVRVYVRVCVFITLTDWALNSQKSTKKYAVTDPVRGLLDRRGTEKATPGHKLRAERPNNFLKGSETKKYPIPWKKDKKMIAKGKVQGSKRDEKLTKTGTSESESGGQVGTVYSL